jgi:hypothetical protein
VRQRGPGGPDGGQQVDRECEEPVVVGHAEESTGAGRRRAHVVHDDVDTAERGDRRVDQLARTVRCGQIHGDRGRAGRGEFVAGGLGPGHDPDTLGGQRLYDRQPDALAGPGDHRDAAVQSQLHAGL